MLWFVSLLFHVSLQHDLVSEKHGRHGRDGYGQGWVFCRSFMRTWLARRICESAGIAWIAFVFQVFSWTGGENEKKQHANDLVFGILHLHFMIGHGNDWWSFDMMKEYTWYVVICEFVVSCVFATRSRIRKAWPTWSWWTWTRLSVL